MSNDLLAAELAGDPNFHPLAVPALANGGVWSSRLNYVSIGGGSYSWSSLATIQEGTRFTSSAAFDKPTRGVAANGVPVWDLTHATFGGGFIIDTPHACLRAGGVGSIAGWFKAAAADVQIHAIFDAWPDPPGKKRLWVYKNDAPTKLSVYGSPNGDVDASTTWKYNNTENVQDFTQWTFIRVSWDFDGPGVNYTDGGGNYSDRLVVAFNEVPDRGQGFSAPPAPYSSPPGGPVTGSGLYSATPQRLTVGVTGSSTWVGQVGHVFVAHGDEGLSSAVWQRIMNWDRPA